jgi:alkanesulfonate monooxygenase SsuD/methylene tetrahydromethanopterin reductase-like flavin-dependent oxidoreductase (luciferase family)
VFGPLPPQGAHLPIWIGGRNEKALRRAGRIADGYHASSTSPGAFEERIPALQAGADEAGRPLPRLSSRVRVDLDGPAPADSYSMHGSPEEIAREIAAFAAVGVDHLALGFPEKDPEGLARSVERFVKDVLPLV